MAGILDRLQGLGTNPFFQLGTGLLSQPTLGQGVQQGLLGLQQAQQFAQGQQTQELQRQLLQARLAEQQRQAAQREQRQGAVGRLGGLLFAQPETEPGTGAVGGGGLLAGSGITPEAFQTIAQAFPQVASGLLGNALTPQPQELEGSLREFQQAMALGVVPEGTTFAEFRELKRGGPGVEVNVGNDKLLTPNEIKNLRMPDGSRVPFGITESQARKMNLQVVDTPTEGERTRETGLAVLSDDIDQFESLLTSDDNDVDTGEPGVLGRAKSAIGIGRERLTGEGLTEVESDIDVLSASMRLAAQQAFTRGDVSERELGTLLALVPSREDLPQQIKSKLKRMRELIKNILQRSEKSRGQSDSGASRFIFNPEGKLRRRRLEASPRLRETGLVSELKTSQI